MIFGFARKKNIFLLQHYHPIRHIHCQIAASEFPTDFDSWDMLSIIGSRSLLDAIAKYDNLLSIVKKRTLRKYGHISKASGIARKDIL